MHHKTDPSSFAYKPSFEQSLILELRLYVELMKAVVTSPDPLKALGIRKQSYTGSTVIDSDWGLDEVVG